MNSSNLNQKKFDENTDLEDLIESGSEPLISLNDLVQPQNHPDNPSHLAEVADSQKALYDGLSPIRCFNYHTQLRVAGRLISESLEEDKSAVLILDKNAEEALEMLEGLGFTLRQALLERKLDIYYYRNGVRNRNFFKKDYEEILNATLRHRTNHVHHLIMIEFNTLFANSVKEAVTNQIEDFCNVARTFDVSVSGLYSPTNWYQNDFLSDQLPDFLGKNSVKEAKAKGGTGIIKYSIRSTKKNFL